MSSGGVHDAEMPTPQDLDDAMVEAFLSGRSVAAAELGPLAAFAEDLRAAASGPSPVPMPQLARLLAEGFSIENGGLPAAAATTTRSGPHPAGQPTRRRPKMTISELLAALMSKLAALGVAAKAALGLGLATATAAAAGAVGVLPDPAQHAVATVVNAVSPVDIPDTGTSDVTKTVGDLTGTNLPQVGDVTGTGTGDDTQGTDTEGTDDQGTGGQATQSHGACVSEVAHNAPHGPGGVHGRAVSEAAHNCPKPEGGDEGSTTSSTSTSTTSTTMGGGAGTATAGPGGQGHGQSHGQSGQSHGNSGHDH